MLLKETTSKQDRIDIALEMYNLIGITKKTLRKTKIGWFVVIIIGIGTLVMGYFMRTTGKNDNFRYFIYLFGIFYIIRSMIGLIFLEREYKARVAKKLKKYDAEVLKRYNISENIETIIEVTDSYIETVSLGTISRYNLQDYITNSESEKFYILEFSNGRYIFLKKEILGKKENYDAIIKTIEEKENILLSGR
ncbi:prevent-host-death family protein [Treponema denticola]|uniref:prevent-host-death family protein n=1 Tax=Treponema denticola TaxID=158 RepID=UPI0020A43B6A|nr:prevent-host-death family protein [Treponema denticola]UTD04993.1 prevent-host-death family protein [Treponema denticola]